PPDCTPDFRTYPNNDTVAGRVNGRIPLFHLGGDNLDVVYKYNDPNCKDANGALSQEHRAGTGAQPCRTPVPNDPPSNATVEVKVTKELPAPLKFFAGIFGVSDTITASAGGGTRGE